MASTISIDTALPFERVVPEDGVEILGHYLPGGTVVGGNPYVVNRHQGTFGQDAELWRPERWLEGGDVHKRKLEQSNLTTCLLDKNIGILEIKKLIPFILLRYNIRIGDISAYEVENSWFFFQQGLYVQIQRKPST